MGLDGVGERSYSQHRQRRVILVNILGTWTERRSGSTTSVGREANVSGLASTDR